MKAKEVAKILVKIYQQELASYQELLRLNKLQNEAIKEENLKILEKLLEEKEEVMNKIDSIEDNLTPYREAIIKGLGLNPNNWLLEVIDTKIGTVQLKQIVNKLVRVIKKVSILDQENQKLIQNKKSKLMKEIDKVKTGSKVNKSYNQKVRIHSTFIDSKS